MEARRPGAQQCKKFREGNGLLTRETDSILISRYPDR